MTEKEVLQKAKEHILAKEFDQAKAILYKLPTNPTAIKWLEKINELTQAQPIKPIEPPNEAQTHINSLIDSVEISQPVVVQPAKKWKASDIIAFSVMLFAAIWFFVGGGFTLAKDLISTNPINCDGRARSWYENEAGRITDRFIETTITARSTSRGSLSSIVLELQRKKWEFEDLDPPFCIEDEYQLILSGMNKTIEGFQNFMLELDGLSTRNLAEASENFSEAYEGLQDLKIEANSHLALSIEYW